MLFGARANQDRISEFTFAYEIYLIDENNVFSRQKLKAFSVSFKFKFNSFSLNRDI